MENSYRQLNVWKKSVELTKKVYKVAEKLPSSLELNLKLQLKRAVVSVAINIAEGKSRSSKKEFAKFLNIAVASLSEVDALLMLCVELELLKREDLKNIFEEITILSKQINALIRKLRS
jgi:four helix bundle protein